MKKTIAIIAIIVILAIAAWLIFYSEEKTQDQEPDQEEEVVQDENEDEEENTDEDDPYISAETVEPVAAINVEMDKHFREVLGEVFEEEPKLVSTGDILILSYVVDRTITSDDVMEISDLLEENGYELEGTDTKENEYDLNFSAEMLHAEYNGNIYVLISTAEEGEDAQKIEVRIL